MKKCLYFLLFVLAASLILSFVSCQNNDNHAHTHSLTYHPAKEPSCVEDGSIEFWQCNDCDKNFLDENAQNEVGDTTIAASHDLVFVEECLPTCNEDGTLEHWVCDSCSMKFSDNSATSRVYNMFLPGEHNFVDGCCEKCNAVGTPELIYELVDERYVVTGIEKTDVIRIVIPSSINGIEVAAIADGAFEKCYELRSVEIGASIVKIGNNVFEGCGKLIEIVNNSDANVSLNRSISVEVHEGESKLKNVSGYLFYIVGDTDSYLVGYVGNETDLFLPEKYVIPDSVRILIPRMVIAENFEASFLMPMFDAMEAILIDHCVELVEENNFSFFNNENYIPYEYGYISRSEAREYLTDMRKLHNSLYKSSSDEGKAFNDIFTDINLLLANYTLLNPKEYEVRPDMLEMIYNNYPITKDGTAVYALDSQLSSSGKLKFSTIIKKYATDYTYQDMYEQEKACGYIFDLYTVADIAFCGNQNIRSIIVSEGVEDVSGRSFDGCINLVSIIVDAENTAFSSLDGNLYSADGKKLIRYAPGKDIESFTVPETVELVERYAFKDHKLNKIIISDGVTEIKNNAFSEIYSIIDDRYVHIVLPESIKKIGDEAFSHTYIYSVTLPDGLLDIGKYAFEYTALEKVHIPASVTSVGVGAFSGNSMISITVDAKNEVYHVTNNCLIDTSRKILVFGTASSVIPNDGSVEIIGTGAFEGMSTLETIHIPSSVLYIMNGAFADCANFKGLTYDGANFFFVNRNTSLENGEPQVVFVFESDYIKDNETHNLRLSLNYVGYWALHRSEETIERYYEIYIDYIT